MDEIKQRMFSSRNLSVSNPGLIVSKFPDLFLCSLISLISIPDHYFSFWRQSVRGVTLA